ncbi:predicted protein [Nematostella vectensis]|uniref:RING-CH-type domain-containing protein n=1 Tax=Nematostella vectensis TaxID=45351 RepID=A7RY85_NEMVE|nr:predicted protein [Nematostella vectensis]|eukprot:XP_001635656.1 predicted protein [Nematostella vectensis]
MRYLVEIPPYELIAEQQTANLCSGDHGILILKTSPSGISSQILQDASETILWAFPRDTRSIGDEVPATILELNLCDNRSVRKEAPETTLELNFCENQSLGKEALETTPELNPKDNRGLGNEVPETTLELSLCNTRSTGKASPSLSCEVICRICHGGPTTEMLIAPCRCCGSAKYVHQSCLLMWFDRKQDKTCELCLYKVEMKPKGLKPPTKWKLPNRSCDFVAVLFSLFCLVLISFIGLVMWVASNRCLSPVCVVLYFVCTIAFLYIAYCCGCVRQIRGYWQSWLDTNREMFILSRKESKVVPAILDFSIGLMNNLDMQRRGRAVHAS